MKFTRRATVPAGREPLWRLLMDIPRTAVYLPGVESIEQVDSDVYRGTLMVRLGPFALRLKGLIIQEEKDQDAWRAAYRAQAADRRFAGAMSGTSIMILRQTAAGTTDVTLDIHIDVLGRIGELGRPIIRRKVDHLLSRFFRNIGNEFLDRGTPSPRERR